MRCQLLIAEIRSSNRFASPDLRQVRLQCFYLLARCVRGAAARAEAEERAEETERHATKKQAELQLDYERRLALAKVGALELSCCQELGTLISKPGLTEG